MFAQSRSLPTATFEQALTWLAVARLSSKKRAPIGADPARSDRFESFSGVAFLHSQVLFDRSIVEKSRKSLN